VRDHRPLLLGKRSLFTFESWTRRIDRLGEILLKKGPIEVTQESEGVDHHPFKVCPACGSRRLEKFDEIAAGMGIDGMSEGQLAEYMAGSWGSVYCLDCVRTPMRIAPLLAA
jgi:hypothetical protein